jgi:hypothetical protein
MGKEGMYICWTTWWGGSGTFSSLIYFLQVKDLFDETLLGFRCDFIVNL